jgi:outer membrane protein assembly factor BamD (BamD/ComL family)
MASKRSSLTLAQWAAAVVLVLGVIIGALHLIVLVGGGAESRDAMLFHVGFAAGALMFGVGLAAIISGLEAQLHRKTPVPSEVVEAIGNVHSAISQLNNTVRQTAAAAANHQVAQAQASAPSSSDGSIHSEALDRVAMLLEDIRELSMMNDAQRQSAYRQHVEIQKQEAITRCGAFVQRQEWGHAEELLKRLSEQFPGDAAVARARQELENARGAVEGEAFAQARQQVDNHMAGSSWDQAFYAARKFADDFPNHAEGQALLSRVIKERELFRESAVGRLYHEIRAEIDNRNWRNALASANRLIDQYPEHPRTHLMRQQLKTVQDNAEIEERQEQEVRIQELIRANRLQDAIDLAEEVIDRYPDSPQAESLDKLLPQMRDMLHAPESAASEEDDDILTSKGMAT